MKTQPSRTTRSKLSLNTIVAGSLLLGGSAMAEQARPAAEPEVPTTTAPPATHSLVVAPGRALRG